MPRLPDNIEKSAFRRGEYVGYGCGLRFRITKREHCWQAVTDGDSTRGARVHSGRTLAALGERLRHSDHIAKCNGWS